MPVDVSLLDLVQLPGSEHLWPQKFKDLLGPLIPQPADNVVSMSAAELAADVITSAPPYPNNPNDKTRWGIIADWLEEPEIHEAYLAQAFRWVAKRPAVRVELRIAFPRGWWFAFADGKDSHWKVPGVPTAILDAIQPFWYEEEKRKTLPQFVALLAGAIRKVYEDLL